MSTVSIERALLTGYSTCDSEDGNQVTLAAHSEEEHSEETTDAAQTSTATEEDTAAQTSSATEEDGAAATGDADEEGAGNVVMASGGLSMIGLVFAVFAM